MKRFLIALVVLNAFGFAGAESITNDAFWKQIDYGWVCPTNMDLDFASNTIFKVSPEKVIYKEDIIRLILGLHERGLATQYGSNQYYVTLFTNSETFTELLYSTNGTPTITNTIVKTNAFGYWMNFRPFLRTHYFVWPPQVPFDAGIRGMLDHLNYVDTRTVYDGSTNFGFWGTRSNLFTYLDIGGNVQTSGAVPPTLPYLFTAVPGFTNIFTNYPVCYTQIVASYNYVGNTGYTEHISETQQNVYYYYQYSTNLTAVTNTYLSPSSQTVNWSTGLLRTDTYMSTQYWWNVTNFITIYRSDRPRYQYTNFVFDTSQVYSQTNITHYQRGDWSYWGWQEPYYLWQELGGGTDWGKYEGPAYHGEDEETWPTYSYPNIIGMWRYEEGFLGLRRQQAYRIILEERYKVLQSFQYTFSTNSYTGFSRTVTMSSNNTDAAGLAALKANAEAAFTNAPVAEAQTPYAYAQVTRGGTAPTNMNWTVTLKRSYGIWKTGYVNTNVAHDKPQAYVRGRLSSALWTFANHGDTINSTSSYTLSAESVESDVRTNYTIIVGTESLPAPTDWPDTPTNNATWTKGYLTDATDRKVVIKWNFLYATNKYW